VATQAGVFVKQLLFSLPYGIAFRNVVCCGTLQKCLEAQSRATLLIPDLSQDDMQRLAGQIPEGVGVRRLMPTRHSATFTGLKLLKQHFYAKRTGLKSFRVRRERRKHLQPWLHVGATFVERVAETLCSEEWVDEQIRTAPQPFEKYYGGILDELQTDVVILAKPGYQPEDLALIKAARLREIPTISVDTTWDNIVSKRPTYLPPDAMTAWSARMRDEAVDFYRLAANGVLVTGGAPFDVFSSPSALPSRSAFLKSLDLDPSRKLIVFTLNSPQFSPQNPLFIKFVLDAVAVGAIRGGPNVIIRMHPRDRDSNHREVVRGHRNVRLERPFGVTDPKSVYECIPAGEEVLHYGALMIHADVVINIGSTTSLDAIAADTPVVNIGFDIEETSRELSSATLFEYSHYASIVESRAVRLTSDRDTFFAVVNAYLDDPSLDGPFRTEAKRSFLTFDDGHNSDRIAEAITRLC
jgi:hypothetical protein